MSKIAKPNTVVVHPLVLLSTVDHYNRVAKDTRKRVVGVLLGETFQGRVDVTNSFAVPFEEDQRNPNIMYLDHDYLEFMANMFRRINAKERIIGFYSTGPQIRVADLKIDEMFRKYCSHPVLVIIDIRSEVADIPCKSYYSEEVVQEDGKAIVRTFKHIASEIGAYEAEEVGVEHLLRDVNDPSLSSLSEQVRHKIQALKGLKERLNQMVEYLGHVLSKKLPVNKTIIKNIQTILNLLPNLNVEDMSRAMLVKTNDMHLVIYLSSLIRSIIALHDLVNNKLTYKDEDDEVEEKKVDAEETSKEKTEEVEKKTEEPSEKKKE